MRLRAPAAVLAAALLTTGLAACGGSDEAGGKPTKVVLMTHDSFALPKKLERQFEQQSGYQLEIRASGDAGELTNKLVLSADNPDGDVAFGVDNTFAGRALDHDVFADYTPADLPAGVGDYDVPGDGGKHLTPVDQGNVCVNVDTTWFAQHHLAPPKTLDDLVDPAYKDLFVTPGATTSSPGLAFLLTTISRYGDGWQDYWKKLIANGAKVDDGWDQAYEVDFTQGGGKGTRPIVLSYDSSPAYTVKGGTTTTKALLDTCFTQVEYAGVLAGAVNPDGAQALVDFLLSSAVQKALPTSMYVFPVVKGTPLPKEWARFAVQPTKTWKVDPQEIDDNRDEWLQQWSDVISG
ncbi:thiamine ABC transporter substrate-binding protein [Nocardioides cheoyonin]|uniref:thiamine ABC transporter substrate-binding protein n=1 Tax=Nocardioides cheoyonin TaxID=3156615 RepID=UPI0032B4FFE6